MVGLPLQGEVGCEQHELMAKQRTLVCRKMHRELWGHRKVRPGRAAKMLVATGRSSGGQGKGCL
jgi:hypothetical protein